MADQPTIGLDAQTMCQALLRMDTTNPPGNERPAAEYLQARFEEVGYRPVLLDAGPQRTNLVVRRKGRGTRPPLLLTAHLDVVEAYPEHWKYPPFSGELAEGCLWGRGAIDMKNMAAMCSAVLRRLARDDVSLERDVIFAAVADEEAGCNYGSKWLVENHRDLVEAEYAIGESGGFSMHIAGSTFYPVQVAEKGLCWIRARIKGQPGHGSMPIPDSAIAKLGEALEKLSRPLPVHETPWVRNFIEAVGRKQPALVRPLLRVLSKPALLAKVLPKVPDATLSRGLMALLSNTVSPTVVRAGDKLNVIPAEAEFHLDGRTLPGQSDDDLLRELQVVLGPDVELEVIKSEPPTVTEPIESPLFAAMEAAIVAREPDATVLPYMIPGFTDAKYFTQMGARWYGFSPVRIERGSGIRFADMFHGHNERVPVAGLHWGTEVLYQVVVDFCS